MNLLQLSHVSDQVNMALHCRVCEMEVIMGCYLGMLERRGRLVHADRVSMLESFVRIVGQFRDDPSEEYDMRTHESEEWQYESADVVLRRLMQLSFCVSGNVNQSYSLVNISLPQWSSENVSSVVRTILSWCQSRGVRSLHSIPDDLVAERSDNVVSMNDLWERVSRAQTNGYRESVFERMVFNIDGDRAAVQKLEVNIISKTLIYLFILDFAVERLRTILLCLVGQSTYILVEVFRLFYVVKGSTN